MQHECFSMLWQNSLLGAALDSLLTSFVYVGLLMVHVLSQRFKLRAEICSCPLIMSYIIYVICIWHFSNFIHMLKPDF